MGKPIETTRLHTYALDTGQGKPLRVRALYVSVLDCGALKFARDNSLDPDEIIAPGYWVRVVRED